MEKQNTNPVKARDNCLQKKKKKCTLCFGAFAHVFVYATAPVKKHQTQTAIYLAVLIHMTVSHNIISIIYRFTNSPNGDKMICHQ